MTPDYLGGVVIRRVDPGSFDQVRKVVSEYSNFSIKPLQQGGHMVMC